MRKPTNQLTNECRVFADLNKLAAKTRLMISRRAIGNEGIMLKSDKNIVTG